MKTDHMKNNFILLLSIIIGSMGIISCSTEDVLPNDPILGLGGDDYVPTELDNYLYESFVIPYNIEVKYRWDPYELNVNRNLVPPEEEQVRLVMETVKAVWMDPYTEVGGSDFLKRYQIMKYILAGSPEYQEDGTIVLGTAEGGNKIVLFAVNVFNPKNRPAVTQMMHTIHHEFAHILHQQIAIPQGWRGLSSEWYTATWYNTSNQQAQAQGLVTAYAKSSMEEDFVETISVLLVHGQQVFEEIVANNPSQAEIFRKKEALVIAYFKDLGVDFRALQVAVAQGIDRISQ